MVGVGTVEEDEKVVDGRVVGALPCRDQHVVASRWETADEVPFAVDGRGVDLAAERAGPSKG